MHLLIAHPDDQGLLEAEIELTAPGTKVETLGPGLATWKGVRDLGQSQLPLTFCRQMLPDARYVHADSVSSWADRLVEAVAGVLHEGSPWRFHLWAGYGEGRAGIRRCELIRRSFEEALAQRRRHLARALEESHGPWTEATSLVQLLLTRPEGGFLSVAPAPLPWRQRGLVSTWVRGDVPVAVDKAAPSRAFAKLVEAEQRLGSAIAPGETCVDLGAAPGSWTYVALRRGARVVAVDRAPLREDLMRTPQLTFQTGDAFRFRPERPVDWLLCDVVAFPARSVDLLLDWARARWMGHFVVSLKFKGAPDFGVLGRLKRELPVHCADWRLTRLCANRNEACAFGVVRDTPGGD